MSGAYGGAAYGGAAYMPVTAQSSFGGTFPYQVITEIAFASNPLDDPAVWTDVSLYTQSIQTNRGRQHELNRFEAGTATVVLDNKDGRFSPFNTSSPYNPNVLPYKQIRVRALYNGVYYPIFRGHIESWPVKWPAPNDSLVTISCVDATKILNLKKALTSLSTYSTTILASTPFVYWRLGEAQNVTTVADSSGNGRTGQVVTQVPTTGTRAFSFGYQGAIVGDLNTSLDCGSTAGSVRLQALNFDATNSTIEFWVQYQSPGGGDDVFQINNFNGVTSTKSITLLGRRDGGVFVFAFDGTNSASFTSVANLADGRWHHVALVTAASTVTMYVDGYTDTAASASPGSLSLTGMTSIGLGGSIGLSSWDGKVDEFAMYSSALSAATVQAHFNAGSYPLTGQQSGARIASILSSLGWPASLQKLDTGLIPVQPGTNDLLNNTGLANIQVVVDTELGEQFIGADGSVVFYDQTHKYRVPNGTSALTLGDSGVLGPGGESPYILDSVDIQFDDQDLYNEAVVTPANLGPQIASDVTSQTSYGKRTTSKQGIQVNASDALSEAQLLVDKFKTPLQRIRSIRFTPMSDPTVLLPAALGFELLTRVTVKRRPKDASSSTFTQDSLIEGIQHTISPGFWQTTYALSPSDASPLFFVLDDPVAGMIGGSGVLV